jgi:uncharacterized iron-regulated membrane protein
VKAFLHRPQSVLLRKALFQIHLWVGIAVGLYVVVISVTGAALMSRIDMQRAIHPDLFTPSRGDTIDAATMLERVRDAFPNHRVSGIDAPTTARPTYLAYVANDEGFLTLLFDPVTATLLGDLPPRSFVRTLQDLHFDLLAGRTGRIVNGVGGLLLLALCLTGLVIWWPGIANWRRALTVDVRRGWKRVNWDLHSAIGIWAGAMMAMWAVTGAYFAWPSQFRAAVNAVSALTVTRAPSSGPASAAGGPVPTWRELIDAAQRQLPDQHVARVVPPSNETDAFLVMFSRETPSPVGPADLTSVYLDQYTGVLLAAHNSQPKTAGDLVMAWISPLHVGSFGGMPIRIAWLVLGLAPAVLFVTGFFMWWTRVVRPRWLPSRRAAEEAAA